MVEFIRTSGVWNLEPEGRIKGFAEDLTLRHRRYTTKEDAAWFKRAFGQRRWEDGKNPQGE
jgi:hypothetical protein